MFTNQTPYTDFHELNLDWVLKQLDKFREELATLEDKVYKLSPVMLMHCRKR